MATRITATRGRDGKPDTVVIAPVEIPDTAREVAAHIDEAKNPLAAWLLNDEEEPLRVEKFEIEGAPEPFWIRRLDLAGLSRIGMMSARNREGRLILTEEGHLEGLLAAMLFVALASDATGQESLFQTYQMAYKVATSLSKRALDFNQLLFNRILDINPDILPKPDNEKQNEESGDFLEQTPASSNAPNSITADSLKEMVSNV